METIIAPQLLNGYTLREVITPGKAFVVEKGVDSFFLKCTYDYHAKTRMATVNNIKKCAIPIV